MTKEITVREMTIKLRKIRSVKKIGVGSYEYKDLMYLVDIEHGYGEGGIGFSVKCSNNYPATLRRIFRKIMEELHL